MATLGTPMWNAVMLYTTRHQPALARLVARIELATLNTLYSTCTHWSLLQRMLLGDAAVALLTRDECDSERLFWRLVERMRRHMQDLDASGLLPDRVARSGMYDTLEAWIAARAPSWRAVLAELRQAIDTEASLVDDATQAPRKHAPQADPFQFWHDETPEQLLIAAAETPSAEERWAACGMVAPTEALPPFDNNGDDAWQEPF